jgi:transcriptional regulator GlxA family with amidase domain
MATPHTTSGDGRRRPGGPPGTLAVDTLIALRRARDLIDRHYAEPLDLDAIAEAAGYSRYHFARAFHTAYGRSPVRYLALRRVERAQELLRSTSLSVTEICLEVGFTSLGSFSSRFSELTGTSPSRFREQARRRNPAPIPACHLLMHGGPVNGSAGQTSGDTAGRRHSKHGEAQ